MTGDYKIPLPSEWSELTAAGTRFGIMYELYSIVNWHDPRYRHRLDTYVKDFSDTFFDDYPMADNPESMIGQSLYEDEIEEVKKFVKSMESFFHQIDVSKIYYKLIHRNDIIIPDIVIEYARDLYELMKKKGDPEIEKYYLGN